MRIDELRKDVLIEGLTDEPMRVIEYREVGGGLVELALRGETTGNLVDRTIWENQLADCRVLREPINRWAMTGDPALFRLVSEAYRMSHPWVFDPQLATTTSMIQPLPHQLMAVYENMLPRQPLRFLLADDPGAGKTIMAGLLLRELQLREDVERCLIVVPASLAGQWRGEMETKFDIRFELVDRNLIESMGDRNVFDSRKLLIGSIDLLKQDRHLDKLREAGDWDLVIFDEAHKMTADYLGDEIIPTARYQVGEAARHKTRHLLLMTATPHSGNQAKFQLFMQLLDEDRFEGQSSDAIRPTVVADVMRRVLKEDLTDFDGNPLFPERFAHTAHYQLEGLEQQLYEEVSNYVRHEMNRAERLANQRRNVVGFALMILQRRLASSPAAIHESLQRRRERLEEKIAELISQDTETVPTEDIDRIIQGSPANEDEELLDEFEEEYQLEADSILGIASTAQTLAELTTEVEKLSTLEKQAKRVRDGRKDRKWSQLESMLNSVPILDEGGRREKVVIFTEHVATLNYLVEKVGWALGNPDSVVSIHGQMDQTSRRRAQQRFNDDASVHVLVGTDAAGEGIDLQSAHLMVNYDLPWNPNRLEQRFGRIHRFGQQEICHLYNLVAENTIEGGIYTRLLSKLDIARQALGGQVYDVLGEAFAGQSLRSIIWESIRTANDQDATRSNRQTIEQQLELDRIHSLVEERALSKSGEMLDVGAINDDRVRAGMSRLVPFYIEQFVGSALKALGSSMHDRKGVGHEIRRLPAEVVSRINERGDRKYESKNIQIRFSKPDANSWDGNVEFVTPDHPLTAILAKLLMERHGDVLRQGCILIDPTARSNDIRILFTFETAIYDGNDQVLDTWVDYAEITIDRDTSWPGTAPYLDYRIASDEELALMREKLNLPTMDDQFETDVKTQLNATHLRVRVADLQKQREVEIDRISEIVQERLDAEAERLRAEARRWRYEIHGDTSAIANAERNEEKAEELIRRRNRRLETNRRLRQIVMRPTRTISACLVVPEERIKMIKAFPSNVIDVNARRRIEKIAMTTVIDHERACGREPIDVSDQNKGWDIESRNDRGNLIMIEVKGRTAGERKITMSTNEYFAGRNEPDNYRLAIVMVRDNQAESMRYYEAPRNKQLDQAIASVTFHIKDLKQVESS